MCNIPVLSVVVAGVGVLFAIAAFYPAPPLSPELLTWKEQGTFFKYDGHNIFYMDLAGTGNQGTLVCLHGFPTFSWDWSKILPGLKKKFSRLILLDFLGFGLSDKPLDHNYSMFEQADIVTQLADVLKLESVHLLAHDYGDTVALELLARFSDLEPNKVTKSKSSASSPVLRLQSVTLLNGGVFKETCKPRILQKLLVIPVLGPFLGRLTFFVLFRKGFGEVFGKNQPSDEEFMNFYAGLCHKNGHHVSSGLLHYMAERAVHQDRWVGALKNSPVPVLMVYGPADPVNPSPDFPQHFRKEVPQHKLVVLGDDIGHYPQCEDADAVLRHLNAFIDKVTQKSAS